MCFQGLVLYVVLGIMYSIHFFTYVPIRCFLFSILGCAMPEFPGVYADVASGIGWIESVVCDSSTGWDLSSPFCSTPVPVAQSVPPPTSAPTAAATATAAAAAVPIIPAPTPSRVDSPSQTYSAQYVLFMEHYTDDLSAYGELNSPTYYPLVRYTCRGTFNVILEHYSIRSNPNITCVDYSDTEGFTGMECRHICDDCSYWWNNAGGNFGENWAAAGVWFQCSGDSVDDLEAKTVWVDEGNLQINVPNGIDATNAKLARLAVRNDYSKTTDELISEGIFPPTDRTTDYVSFADSDPADFEPNSDIFVSSTGAFDGGYIAWTGVSLCSGNCNVDFGDLVIKSVPTLFPTDYYQP